MPDHTGYKYPQNRVYSGIFLIPDGRCCSLYPKNTLKIPSKYPVAQCVSALEAQSYLHGCSGYFLGIFRVYFGYIEQSLAIGYVDIPGHAGYIYPVDPGIYPSRRV